MGNIHIIGGEKGGVGKSVVARAMAQYLIDKGLPFVGFDSDRSHGALLRFYGGYATPLAVDRYESLDAIVEAAAQEPDRRVLVDLAAQTHESFVRWIDDSGLLDMATDLGLAVRYWHVMDSGKDSVDLLKALLDRFHSQLSYAIVLNEIRGDDFTILERSGEKERALELHAQIISLKKLHEAAMRKIDARSSSFWAATNHDPKEVGGLGLMERQRVKIWLKHAYGQFDTLAV
jgi:hypothetical protein